MIPRIEDSIVDILLHTPHGRRVLFSGVVYTLIISVLLSSIYVFSSPIIGVSTVLLYSLTTILLVMRKSPRKSVTYGGITIFTIIPIIATAIIILLLPRATGP